MCPIEGETIFHTSDGDKHVSFRLPDNPKGFSRVTLPPEADPPLAVLLWNCSALPEVGREAGMFYIKDAFVGTPRHATHLPSGKHGSFEDTVNQISYSFKRV